MDNPNINENSLLTPEQHGIALELANLTSGACSATLGMLLDQNFEVGQPEVLEFETLDAFVAQCAANPSVLATLRFQNGLHGPLGYLLDCKSSLAIADVMMGNTPSDTDAEITDIQLSAVGEAISQMMGAVSNNISQFLSCPVDITAPEIALFSKEKLLELIPECENSAMVVIKYPLTAENMMPGFELLQVTPLESLKGQIDVMRTTEPTQQADNAAGETSKVGINTAGRGAAEAMPNDVSMGYQVGAGAAGDVRQTPSNPVTVRPVEYPSFDNHIPAYAGTNKNLELVMDVALNLTVELGRTELPIKEVLELTRGSVIELNRVAGESVDLYANGKMIAKGEVVVIEDNFGLRITSIVSPADRLRGL